MFLRRSAGLALALLLAGCVAKPVDDTSKDATTLCRERCERDFDICEDSAASRRDTGPGTVSQPFGASAACQRELKACLNRCGVLK